MLLSFLALTCSMWLNLRTAKISNRECNVSDLLAKVQAQRQATSFGQLSTMELPEGIVYDRRDGESRKHSLPQLGVDIGVGVFRGNIRLGSAPSTSQPKPKQIAAVYESIRRPEDYLIILGSEEEPATTLFEFAMLQARHCRGISGTTTRLLCECHSEEQVDFVMAAVRADDLSVPVGLILPPDPALWCHVLNDKGCK